MPQAATRVVDRDDDETLARRAGGGDRSAFAALLSRHYAFIFRVACKWSGNRSDAEDAAQEVCVKLAVAVRSFDGRAAFRTWLYRVTLNVVRDHQRAVGRQGRGTDRLAVLQPDNAPPEQEEVAATRELWAAVRRLPPQQRDAVLLVYAEDLGHAEAAAIMACKPATVAWHIHVAKKTLRGLL